MKRLPSCLAVLALLGAATGWTSSAHAESSAASSASDSVATSVGSLSDSVKGSSDSSSHATNVAEGQYRILEVAAADGKPGMARMKLQPVGKEGDDAGFFLILPQQVVDQRRLAAGRVVAAHPRPYGYEFAEADTHRPFFLVLADDWYRELQSKAVVL